MKTTRTFAVLASIAVAGASAWGQALRGNQDGTRALRSPPPPTEQLFLSDKIVYGLIDRLTEQMGEHYGFDEDQLWNVRAAIKDRFPRFLRENQGEIVKVVNDYFGALVGEGPPAPEEVADWAQRVQPLMQKFTGLIEDTTQEIRTYMTDEQQTKLDGEVAMFQVGVNHLNNRLQVWSQGGYDWETEWVRSPAWKEKEAARQAQLDLEQRRAKAVAEGLDPDEVAPLPSVATNANQPKLTSRPAAAVPKTTDEWTAYVENFIKRYKLDPDQQRRARENLREMQNQRDNYLRRGIGKIDLIEKRLKEAKTDEEREKIKADLESVNLPLDNMFKRLKDKLDQIPTLKQRAEAARSETDDRRKAESKPESKPLERRP